MCFCQIAAGSELSKTCFRLRRVLVLLTSPIVPKKPSRLENVSKIVLKLVLGVPCDILFSWRWKICRQESWNEWKLDFLNLPLCPRSALLHPYFIRRNRTCVDFNAHLAPVAKKDPKIHDSTTHSNERIIERTIQKTRDFANFSSIPSCFLL